MPDFDVVIIGSGPGGATAADVLTAAGKSVCILEKGRNHLLALEPPFDGLGHLSNDEIKFDRRHFLGPDPLLEPRTYRRSTADGDRSFTGDVNNMPSTVGGAGYHADGKLPRYREIDFRLASELGPVDGADVADWPVDYDEMEPYYAEAERAIGVAGDHTANPFAAWRADPYPMPPGADMFLTTLTAPAAERLGYHPYRAPTGVNSVAYDGRPACNNCGFSAFSGCPIEAKGDPVALLRRALRTGNCEIRPESVALEVLVDGTGKKSRGVRYLDADGVHHEVSSDAVVVACGAFETPRLLLRSGIGNASDLVGRYLMFHLQTLVLGLFPDPAPCVQGPRRHASHGRSDHRRRRKCGSGEGGGRAVPARWHRRTWREWSRDQRGAVHGCPAANTAPAWRSRTVVTGWPPSPCRARICRSQRTVSTSIPRYATFGVCRSDGSPTRLIPSTSRARSTGARGSRRFSPKRARTPPTG